MKNYILEAYKLGRATAMQKQAWWWSKKQPEVGDYFTDDYLKKMLGGAGIGALGGMLIGGQYNRLGGALGGALTGAIAANPELVAHVISKGSESLSNFFNKK